MGIPQNFHIGIKALIVKRSKVLLLKDVDRFAGFDLPGGKIDEGETIQEALKRELREELGLKSFKLGKFLGVFERRDYKKKGISLMLIFYKVDAKISNIKLSFEHTSYEWVSKKDLSKIKIRNQGIKEAIAKVLK